MACKEIQGDIITLAFAGNFDIIIQSCNCFNTMGKGLALQIKNRMVNAYLADCKTKRGDKNELGKYSYGITGHVIIINAYTQYFYSNEYRVVDYDAMRSVFSLLKKDFSSLRFGIPRISCSNAGGEWNTIKQIILEELMMKI